jgi:nitroreductase
MEISDAIKARRAVRSFTPAPVPDDVVTAILDAGRRSQSSKNTQPWQFVVVRERATLEALSKTGPFAGHLAGAAFGVVLVDMRGGEWGAFDVGQAAALMQLVAWERGVGSCLANLYEPDKARALLGIPAEAHVFAALSFGYASEHHVPAKLGGRRPLDETVHWDKW